MDWKDIEIIQSPKRKKTIQAKIVDTTLYIYLPSTLSAQEEAEHIEKMKEKMRRKKQRLPHKTNNDLTKRAEQLNNQYFESSLSFTIQFVTNQQKKFGSCTPSLQSIRISERCANMPRWVLDYIITHELAHLIHPNHSKAFWKQVYQYPYVERAKGFLIAYEIMSKQK